MIRQVCSVVDRASQLYGQPFFVASVGQAMRSFADEVNRKAADNQLASHPEDFELFLIAVFDDEAGTFGEPLDGARLLCRGKEVVIVDKE